MIIFISGSDSFLAGRAISQIKQKYLQKNPGGAELIEITPDILQINWADLQAVPLFATSRLVVIKSAGKLDKNSQENLAHFLKIKPDTTVVILWDEKKIDPKSALTAALQDAKQTLSAEPLSLTATEKHTLKRAKELNIGLSSEQLRQILNAIGNDLWAIENELIFRSNSNNNAGSSIAKKIIQDEPFAVFSFVRNGQWGSVKKIIRDELSEGMPIEMIIGGVAAAVRKESRDANLQHQATDLMMDIDVGLKTGALDDEAAAALLIAYLPNGLGKRVQWEDQWGETTSLSVS